MEREKINVRQFEMIPKTDEKAPEVSEGDATAPPAAVEKWYSIDNDNYEVKPIHVTVLPESIKMFAPPKSG